MPSVPAQPRPDRDLGVFETLLIVAGEPVEVDAHLERLAASLAALYPDRRPPDVGAAVGAVAERVDEGGIRITVVPRGRRLALSVDLVEIEPELLLPATPRPVAVRSLEVPGGLGSHKWVDRSLLEAGDRAADTLDLILDRDDAVLECSRANVFAVSGNVLRTPPLDGRILPGISRARVLDIAGGLGLEAREEALCRDDLIAADQVLLSGSLRGIESVRALDGAALSPRGDVGARLAAGLRRAWRRGLDRVPRR